MEIREGDYVKFNEKRILSGKDLLWGFTDEAIEHIRNGNKPMIVHSWGYEGAEIECPEFNKKYTLSVDYDSLVKVNNKIRRI